ncbi:MAG TPA: caspase family protein, partial [Gemmatimonadaceae bacterium]|nr:caspase family protein [Gemmatimonadaceae bacterium]
MSFSIRLCTLLLPLFAALPIALEAQTRRAIVVGINRYDAVTDASGSQFTTARRITNLNGAVNDATSMRDVLVSRFGFPAGNTTLLT